MNEQLIGMNIRRIRTAMGHSLTALAKKAGITKSTLSKIETGQISSPVSTLIRIANSVGVELVDFFVEEPPKNSYVLTRKGKGEILTRGGSEFGYSYQALALDKRNKIAEPFLLTINPGDKTGKFSHTGQEFIYILSGSLEFTVGGEKLVLKSGDSLYFDSAVVHTTKVVGSNPVKFICIFIPNVPKEI